MAFAIKRRTPLPQDYTETLNSCFLGCVSYRKGQEKLHTSGVIEEQDGPKQEKVPPISHVWPHPHQAASHPRHQGLVRKSENGKSANPLFPLSQVYSPRPVVHGVNIEQPPRPSSPSATSPSSPLPPEIPSLFLSSPSRSPTTRTIHTLAILHSLTISPISRKFSLSHAHCECSCCVPFYFSSWNKIVNIN